MCYCSALPDNYTLATMAKVSGEVGDLVAGKWVHGKSIRAGIVMDTFVANSLMSMYWYGSTTDHGFDKGLLETTKCMMMSGVKPDGRVFDRMKCRNVYAWTAMVNGYVQNGASDEALILFRKMQVEDGIQPNRVSLVSVLPACVIHAVLMGGKQIHGFAIRKEMNHDKFLTKGFDPYPCMRFLSLV
ncbi:hypothetical protein M0R45_003346 [Rubus argutus]|uniref:Pentatricopeptide repeat-containing protein n=1 Tax=Rubus argutus TaxID=59490 RepID=A0AAW1YER8_RUBAR